VKEKVISIRSEGIILEGLLSNQEALQVRGGVVLCHPHPLYGGDMHNTVIAAAAEAASVEGFCTLRFNFRGVGGSSGSFGEGIGEKEDVKAAIEYLSSKMKGHAPSLIVVGYSFGAWVALPVAAEDNRIGGMVAIAPPLELYDFQFLVRSRKDKLLIAGTNDCYCPLPLLEKVYERLEEPKSLNIIPEADHFFSIHYRSLIEPLREFFKRDHWARI
jgi:alpha/beta superfamily hydrolase